MWCSDRALFALIDLGSGCQRFSGGVQTERLVSSRPHTKVACENEQCGPKNVFQGTDHIDCLLLGILREQLVCLLTKRTLCYSFLSVNCNLPKSTIALKIKSGDVNPSQARKGNRKRVLRRQLRDRFRQKMRLLLGGDRRLETHDSEAS